MEKMVEVPIDIIRVMNSIEKEGYTAVWIPKEYVKTLRVMVKEKYPDARIEKLSGSNTYFLFISVN